MVEAAPTVEQEKQLREYAEQQGIEVQSMEEKPKSSASYLITEKMKRFLAFTKSIVEDG